MDSLQGCEGKRTEGKKERTLLLGDHRIRRDLAGGEDEKQTGRAAIISGWGRQGNRPYFIPSLKSEVKRRVVRRNHGNFISVRPLLKLWRFGFVYVKEHREKIEKLKRKNAHIKNLL